MKTKDLKLFGKYTLKHNKKRLFYYCELCNDIFATDVRIMGDKACSAVCKKALIRLSNDKLSMQKRVCIKIPNKTKVDYLPVVKELIEVNDILWVDTVDCDSGIVYRIDFAEISQKCDFAYQMEKKGINTLLVV